MSRRAGRIAVVSISDAAASAAAKLDPPPRRLPATFFTALLAGAAAVALATLLTAQAPWAPAPPSPQLQQGPLLRSMPDSLAPAASASIGASDRSFWPAGHDGAFHASGGGIHSAFTSSGVRLRVVGGTLGFALAAAGRGRHLSPEPAVAPGAAANQVLYRRGAVTEFYRNGPYGLEQGFTVRERPQTGRGVLALALGLSGSLTATQSGSQILFRTHAGAAAARYGELSAVDATGRGLPVRARLNGGILTLTVDDSGARYPVRIDPFIQGAKLRATGEVGEGHFGKSVALSADAGTALIGAPADNGGTGAAFVFMRSGSTWSQQGAKLTGQGETGKGSFGTSVALSADASTALIGAPADNGSMGAAFEFMRSGSTWSQQGAKLTGKGEVGNGSFGTSVALSADGSTAAIGGSGDNGGAGAAWAFTRSGSTWSQQGTKLTGEGETGRGLFGTSVALSADGSTALIGVPYCEGGGWVFVRSGSAWAEQMALRSNTAECPTPEAERDFGERVALSADGGTALVAGPGPESGLGGGWVYTRSGSTWPEQAKLGRQAAGESAALSSDGNTALLGGTNLNEHTGGALVFTRSGSSWAAQGEELPVEGGEFGHPTFGSSAALSADGNTALVGGPEAEAAWVFSRPSTAVGSPEPPVTHTPPATGSGTAGASSGQGVLSFQTSKAPAAPDASLASTSVAVSRSGIAIVRVTCPAGVGACTGTIVLQTLRAVGDGATANRSTKRRAAVLTLATGSFAVAGGRVKAVTLRLSRRARALLARARVLRVRATIAAHDSVGRTHTARTIVTLRAIKPARDHRNS